MYIYNLKAKFHIDNTATKMETKIVWLCDNTKISYIITDNIKYKIKDKTVLTIFDKGNPIIDITTFYEIGSVNILNYWPTSSTVIRIKFNNLPSYLDQQSTQSFWIRRSKKIGYECTINAYENNMNEHICDVIHINENEICVISRIDNYGEKYLKLFVRLIDTKKNTLINKDFLTETRTGYGYITIDWKYDGKNILAKITTRDEGYDGYYDIIVHYYYDKLKGKWLFSDNKNSW
ncbi:putative ORFan [Tupanvirus deep ocean]|uniref:ORFan n=2 Tax=Tupanvirus TaxID=2094720 RepID=A0AC62A6T3_9VIRU|nr:putative ORFan [Tupanvirus deep ocean]QKU33467.1 putative ORFan [Tupanvirus deep ocean]